MARRKKRKSYRRVKKIKKINRGRKAYNHIEDIEDFYKAINEAQSSNKPVYVVFEDNNLLLMIENILKDAEVKFSKIKRNKKNIYRLISNRNIHEEIDNNAEQMDEEIFSLEDGEDEL